MDAQNLRGTWDFRWLVGTFAAVSTITGLACWASYQPLPPTHITPITEKTERVVTARFLRAVPPVPEEMFVCMAEDGGLGADGQKKVDVVCIDYVRFVEGLKQWTP